MIKKNIPLKKNMLDRNMNAVALHRRIIRLFLSVFFFPFRTGSAAIAGIKMASVMEKSQSVLWCDETDSSFTVGT